ncbi:MAG: 50S ribosomal protein L9 [Verrucomicrobiae bacterium]|nr:50S ribosomal protein L9 [Verrucomicrobiae bacterium]
MSTQLILTTNVKNLGAEGDVVSVADGYARNFLLPRQMAVVATTGAMRRVESLKLLRTERERKELEEAQELGKKIDKLSSTVELQAGEGGKVFGSVSGADIAAALAERGFQVDKRSIQLDEPIKKAGSFEIPIRLHAQVTATFKLTVAIPHAPAAEEAPAARGAKAKSEKARPVRKKKA